MKKKITIVGLGPETRMILPWEHSTLKRGKTILEPKCTGSYLFTGRGIPFSTLDDLYESSDTFEEAYSAMVEG